MRQEKVFDELLIMRCQQGDRQAFELLMKRWNRKIISFTHKYTRDVSTARDIAQEIWLSVYKGIGKLREPEKFSTWIYRLAYNKCMDYLRKVKKHNEVGIDDQAEMEAPQDERVDQWSTVNSILIRMPAAQKTILTLFYLEEQSVRQIAEILNLAEGTVKSRIFYARESLKQKYKEVKNEKF